MTRAAVSRRRSCGWLRSLLNQSGAEMVNSSSVPFRYYHIARAAVSFASQDSSHINGTELLLTAVSLNTEVA